MNERVAGKRHHLTEEQLLAIWVLVMAVAAIWPVVFMDYPAGQDTPNHLARAFILLHPDDPVLAAHFDITWHAVPDLLWDGFAVLVGRVLPLMVTLKIFMILGIAVTVLGLAMINRQLASTWTWMPLMGVPFLFNLGYSKGFLSFNLAIGIALVAIAVWQAGSERHWGRRLIWAALFSTILFYSHLVAWGVYGLTLLGLKLSELVSAWRRDGRVVLRPWIVNLLRDGTQIVPAIILVVALQVLFKQSIELAGKISAFDVPWVRFIQAWHVIDTGWYLPSLIVLGVFAPFLFFLLLGLKVLRFDFTLAVPIALLVFAFFAMPDEIYATHYIVWRLALAATFLAIASGIPTVPVSAPIARWSLGVALLATLTLSGWQAYSIHNAGTERADFMALIDRVPTGQTMFAIHTGMNSGVVKYDRIGLYHFAADAVRTRRIMVQSLFANPSQQPIVYREPQFNYPTSNTLVFFRYLLKALEQNGISPSAYLANFQWIVMHGPDPATDRTLNPLDGFTLAGEVGSFRLYCRIGTSGDAAICPDGKAP